MNELEKAEPLIASVRSGVKQALLGNMIAAHGSACMNATARDLIAIKRFTKAIIRLSEELGDGFVYLPPKDSGCGRYEPPNHLNNPD